MPCDSVFTIIPMLLNAINAKNKPIPPDMAKRRFKGIPSEIHWRIGSKEHIKKRHPDKKIIPSDACHVYPILPTITNANKELVLILGANAIGKFAINPVNSVPIDIVRQVAIKTASKSIPVVLKIEGLTTLMYIILKKVVAPAIDSFFREA